MPTRLGIRLLVAIAVGAIVLLELARWNGVAEARRARDVQIADSAAAAAVQRVAVLRRAAQAAGRLYVGTVAPHQEATAAADRQASRARETLEGAETARAAAEKLLADSSATLQQLRVELRRSADAIGELAVSVTALLDTIALERAAAARRIAAAERRVAELERLAAAQDSLDAARVDQVDTRERRRGPRWRRALGFTCEGATVAGGAGAGALIGPGGAAVGAVVGLVGGRVACR